MYYCLFVKTKCLEELECRNTALSEQVVPILSRALRLGTQLQVLRLESCSLGGRSLVVLGDYYFSLFKVNNCIITHFILTINLDTYVLYRRHCTTSSLRIILSLNRNIHDIIISEIFICIHFSEHRFLKYWNDV